MEEVDPDMGDIGVCDDGHEFFELIADVDNISCDVSVSTECSVTTMR
jgi:hypothetical protein